MEVVIATKGNPFLLDILHGMSEALAEKSKMEYYNDKPCRFIYHTTGPKLLAKVLHAHGYEPHVRLLSMCRPVQDLEKHLSLDEAGRVSCHRSGIDQYDVWSALSMSYNISNPGLPPPLALPLLHSPPYPQNKKRRRYTTKTTEAPADEVDKQTISGYELQPKTEPIIEIKDEKCSSGNMPQQLSLNSENISQEAREAFDDMVRLFLAGRDNAAVNVCYSMLAPQTCVYLESLPRSSIE